MRGKVLVIEANPLILSTVKWAVETAGYEVVSATDGESGLQQFSSCQPDLVILDLCCPADELEVCRRAAGLKDPDYHPYVVGSPDYRGKRQT
jgi:two-component system alkaline phosphatase synthesis response regulator PhoP